MRNRILAMSHSQIFWDTLSHFLKNISLNYFYYPINDFIVSITTFSHASIYYKILFLVCWCNFLISSSILYGNPYSLFQIDQFFNLHFFYIHTYFIFDHFFWLKITIFLFIRNMQILWIFIKYGKIYKWI